ncbi:MAG: DUF6370 family protein [Candidatus Neomarinimicrobiota bacterium]|nr:DUF6370 family protein [Candidatus Neomarinimicrobiota bacterium]|tara:strand:- start:638 stop:1048 length:411 start_codon:yes stop_codon:yes gene_type:complete
MQKKFFMIILISLFIINILYAGCGACPGDNKNRSKIETKQVKNNTLVMSVPKNGEINGLVITSCGMCNFGTKDKGCSLSIKIGEKNYSVKGSGMHDHGDAHGADGLCSAVRVAWVSGKIKKNIFNADSFVLVGNER